MKTLADQIAEATEWAIAQWDSVIDAALKDYGLGAKPSPQQRGAMTRAAWQEMRRTADKMDDLVGPDPELPGLMEE